MSHESPSTTTLASHRWMFQLGLVALAVGALTGGIFYFTTRGVFGRAYSPPMPRADPMSNVVNLEHGLTVYATNCAICHGATGLGEGPSAGPMLPKPRNFSSGRFKLGSTQSGLPSDEDLAATIRRGMLPAAMPPWPQLSEGELKSVVLAVRHLAIEGRVAQRLARDPMFPRDKALHDTHVQIDSGPRIVLPPRPAKIDLARGKVFYTNNCAACHDPDGRGKLREDLVDNDENPIAARDFTSGQFKGGSMIQDIALRISRGLPGSPMPANQDISADDLWSTAAYVRTFFDGPATQAAAQAQAAGRSK